MIEVEKFSGWRGARAHFRTNGVNPVHHLLIKISIFAHGVINALATFDQAGQNIVDVINWKSVIGFVFATSAFGTCAITIPYFTLTIALAHKHHELAVGAARN